MGTATTMRCGAATRVSLVMTERLGSAQDAIALDSTWLSAHTGQTWKRC